MDRKHGKAGNYLYCRAGICPECDCLAGRFMPRGDQTCRACGHLHKHCPACIFAHSAKTRREAHAARREDGPGNASGNGRAWPGARERAAQAQREPSPALARAGRAPMRGGRQGQGHGGPEPGSREWAAAMRAQFAEALALCRANPGKCVSITGNDAEIEATETLAMDYADSNPDEDFRFDPELRPGSIGLWILPAPAPAPAPSAPKMAAFIPKGVTVKASPPVNGSHSRYMPCPGVHDARLLQIGAVTVCEHPSSNYTHPAQER